MSFLPSLYSAQFKSLIEFRAFFQVQQELPIAAHQHLEISGLPLFIHDHLPNEALQRLVSIINRILAPLAQSVTVSYAAGKSNLFLNTNPKQTLLAMFTVPWVVKLQPRTAPLITRIDQLFRMLAFSQIQQVAIASNQPIILSDITENEVKQLIEDKLTESVSYLFENHCPADYTLIWDAVSSGHREIKLQNTLHGKQVSIIHSSATNILFRKIQTAPEVVCDEINSNEGSHRNTNTG